MAVPVEWTGTADIRDPNTTRGRMSLLRGRLFGWVKSASYTPELIAACSYSSAGSSLQTTSLELLAGLIGESVALREALETRGIGLRQFDVAQPAPRWPDLAESPRLLARPLIRRVLPNDANQLVAWAVDEVIDGGRREVGVSDVLRTIAANPRSPAAKHLLRAGLDRTSLMTIADEIAGGG